MKLFHPLRLYIAVIFFGVVLSCWPCEASAQTDTYARAVALFKAKEYRKSADLFRQVEAESPGTTDAMLYHGKCLANLGDFAEAEATLRAYLEKRRESPDALAFLGFVLHRENKPQESLEFYNRAARIETPHADDLKIVALDYVLLNDLQDAVKWLEKCTTMDRSNAECWYYLGRAYFTGGRFREAKPSFQKALELRPRDPKAEDYLGLILESENQREAAIQAYQNAISWQRESGHVSEHPYLHLAMLFDRQGSSEQSIAPLLEGIKVNPQSALLYSELGQVYMHLGLYKEASEQLEKGLSLDPRNASGHFQLGRAYRQLGKREQANAEFAKAQELFGTGQGPTN
jgi:tetratricopeptide (TPR) repeat protein